MFRKQISPGLAAIALVIILGGVQFVYWRLLVYRPPARPAQGGGGGGGGPSPPTTLGRADVQVETFAGEGPGYQDGPGWQARFSGPNALALGPDGSLWVADSRNHRIRRILPSGQVSTEAGAGEPGGPGGRADGPARAAQFRYPSGVAAAEDGTVYIADTGNHRVCRLREGQVTTLASSLLRYPAALHLAADGALWVADAGNAAIRRVDAAGVVTTPAPPAEVAAALGEVGPAARPILHGSVDGAGVPEATQFRVERRGPAATTRPPLRLIPDPETHVVVASTGAGPPVLVAGMRMLDSDTSGEKDGTGNRAAFARPSAVVLAPDGLAYVADSEGNTIRRLRLPGWLLESAPAPERGRRRFGRAERGR